MQHYTKLSSRSETGRVERWRRSLAGLRAAKACLVADESVLWLILDTRLFKYKLLFFTLMCSIIFLAPFALMSKGIVKMADEKHLEILKQGVEVWNQWRVDHREKTPDLREAYLVEADLVEANLSGANLLWAYLDLANLSRANLSEANLSEANLSEANLSGAYLNEANLSEADLSEADLSGANLRGTNLRGANLRWANFTGANLTGANLSEAALVQTDLREADLTGCHVYGVSAWDLNLEGSSQLNLVITPRDQPTVTVDNLEVAQFIYLLLNNEKIRSVIDTITSKVVLILGRFTPERKAILDTIRGELRKRDYLPVLFDFDKPASRDLTETIGTLAHLARFIIADITEPRSIPQELQSIVPDLAVPIQPLLLKGATGEYGMFESFRKYPWILSTYEYSDLDGLLASLEEKVIRPAETKAKELVDR